MAEFYTNQSYNTELVAEQTAQRNLKEILVLQGLKWKKDFNLLKIKLKTLDGYIFTYEGGFANKPILVMTHGYGGSNVFFMKMYKELQKTFHIYSFDMYGMGVSHRYDFKCNDWKSIMDIYALSLEEFRQQLNLQDFYILGYSIGGYVALHYLNMYRPKIRGCYIISSPGFTSAQFAGPEKCQERLDVYLEEGGWLYRTLAKGMYKRIFEKKHNPFSYAWFLPLGPILKDYFQWPSLDLSKTEQKVLYNYYDAMLRLKPSGEGVIGYFVEHLSYSDHPTGDFIQELIEDCGYQFVFLYGEDDWVDVESVKDRLAELPATCKVPIHIIKNAGHMNLYENPTEINDWILEYFNFFEYNLGGTQGGNILKRNNEIGEILFQIPKFEESIFTRAGVDHRRCSTCITEIMEDDCGGRLWPVIEMMDSRGSSRKQSRVRSRASSGDGREYSRKRSTIIINNHIITENYTDEDVPDWNRMNKMTVTARGS
jgi:pimeloyl-ACP methyl ester carboxylesterase